MREAFEGLLVREMLRPLERSLGASRAKGLLSGEGDLLWHLWAEPMAQELARAMEIFPEKSWSPAASARYPSSPRAYRSPEIRLPLSRKPSPSPAAPVAEFPAGDGTLWDAARAAILPGAVRRWDPLIQRVAREANLPANLIRAVVWSESAGRPDAVSSKGAMGLMQLMPATAQEMEVADPFDPLENLRGGAGYLRRLLSRFPDPRLALAAYHAGPGRVAEAGGMPAIPVTQRYVRAVLLRQQALDRLSNAGGVARAGPGGTSA